MALKLTNNATSTLATTITDSATTLSVQSADAGLFPVLGAGDWFPITVVDASNNMEVMKVTARATAVLTVERAQEGTTALAFTAGARIDLRVTAAALQALENANAINGATAKTAPVDADEFGYRNSSGGGFVKSTWAQLKAAIWSGLGALIIGGTSKATPVDADNLALADSADANNTKKLSWANVKATLLAYFITKFARVDAAQAFTALEQAQGRANLGTGLLGDFRNLLINPLGTINQRIYVSGAATSGANQYTLDRWRVVTSGQNVSWTESDGVRTMTAPAGGLEQVVEGASILTGNHVLSWEGTATATVNGVARTNGEVFALTGGSNATVRFSGGTVKKPQLERASSATDFAFRHPKQELALCQWYYGEEQGPADIGAGLFYSSTQAFIVYRFPRMRIAPTLAITGPASAPLIGGGAVFLPTSVVATVLQSESAELEATVSGATAGQGTLLRFNSGARITRNAEL